MHPEQPCRTLERATFDKVWRHSVELLQRGFVTGSILTVDKEDAFRLGPPWTRRYIYNQVRHTQTLHTLRHIIDAVRSQAAASILQQSVLTDS